MTDSLTTSLSLALDCRRDWPKPPRRRFGIGVVDLGLEPPLEVAGAGHSDTHRRAFNWRWLAASVLTGLSGAALLGSAILVSSDGDLIFAESAEPAAASGGGETARKGDKLVRADLVASAKQSFRAPMTTKVADREVIKVRPFVRLTTALSMTSGVYATNIPPFNPIRFFAESAGERPAEIPAETSDAEVSVVKSELGLVGVDGGGPSLTDEDVLAQLREAARLLAESGRRGAPPATPGLLLPPSLALGGAGLSPRPSAALTDPAFRSIEVRVVPENVTTFEKVATPPPDVAFSEASQALRRGDSLEAVLAAAGAGPEDARGIAAALGREKVAAITDGMQLRVLTGPPAQLGGRRRPVRATLLSERGIEAVAAMNDRGAFVPVALPDVGPASPAARARTGDDEEEDGDEGTGVTLYDSLYETALRQELPRATIEDLIRIFGYDVDFQRRVGQRDLFELFYAPEEEGGTERLEILSAALTVGGEVHRVFRFQGEDGSIEYFDGAGRSLKKFLLRKPVPEGRISSPFGSRYHPILGYSKMHTGVDFAAPTGTPIFAAGNGTVIKAEWSSGYGRRTEVQHANGYVTAYNHQSAFGRGVVAGARVRQGQLLGYVGSTGLSTGAHLHYEVLVNGHFVDPMKIRLPRGRELDGRALAEFNRQRDQIDGLMLKAGGPNRLAQRDAR